jgi:hypothetical protein
LVFNPKPTMKKNPPLTCFFTHKLLRATLAVTQVVDALPSAGIGIFQPSLPAPIASLQPLAGMQEVVL